jgi:thymidylate synthase
MRTNNFLSFRHAYADILRSFRVAPTVLTDTWQGVSTQNKPEMATHEIEDYFFQFPIGTWDLDYHRAQIGPNLPWADQHFELDRVCGEPLNPGKTWQDWPWSNKADGFRDSNGQFNHSYAERYWPKLAGKTDQGELSGTQYSPEFWLTQEDLPTGAMAKSVAEGRAEAQQHHGVRYPYGDLRDVVNLLVRNPMTRNAYLPVWFPEDTGVLHGGRTPCSLGYLFRMRGDRLSISYDIRSCDFKRHFQDDVYLTVRLLLWVLQQCRELDDRWKKVKPGNFTMHIGSFHLFKNDYQVVFAGTLP